MHKVTAKLVDNLKLKEARAISFSQIEAAHDILQSKYES